MADDVDFNSGSARDLSPSSMPWDSAFAKPATS
jgi:hypothetical protein